MIQYEINCLFNKEGICVSVAEFEAVAQFSFVPQLLFCSESLSAKICKKTAKLQGKKKLSREQLWFGSYYRNEILFAKAPSIEVRWIDRRIGWGVFAAKDFSKMEFVTEYHGLVRPRKRSDRENAYCFEYALSSEERTPYNIDAESQGGVSRFINHSEAPNLRSALATVDGVCHVIFIVDKPIAKGEQLFYDYGSDYWAQRKVSYTQMT